MKRGRLSLPDVALLGIAIAFVGLRLFDVPPWNQSVDAYAYWRPITGGGPYGDGPTVGAMGAYLYSPAFKLFFLPLGALPWPVFNALWTALNLGLLRAIAGRYALLLLLFPPVPFEIVSGNVHLVLAAVAAWGLARPWMWSFALLTKVTPGIGVLWFAVRREWRPLLVACVVTGLVVAASVAITPSWWTDWLGILRDGQSVPAGTPGSFLPVPLWVRLPASAALLAWGARADRRWTVPVAMMLAMPVLWLNSPAVLVALVPLRARADVGEGGW
ncbi:MAG: glycosyltransferase family 87 protein [Chloroflexota bacterium]